MEYKMSGEKLNKRYKRMCLRGFFDYSLHNVDALSRNNKRKSKKIFQGNGS